MIISLLRLTTWSLLLRCYVMNVVFILSYMNVLKIGQYLRECVDEQSVVFRNSPRLRITSILLNEAILRSSRFSQRCWFQNFLYVLRNRWGSHGIRCSSHPVCPTMVVQLMDVVPITDGSGDTFTEPAECWREWYHHSGGYRVNGFGLLLMAVPLIVQASPWFFRFRL